MGSPFDITPEFPADFTGIVRMFPLPNAVLFPHVLLPLHIFEPRYVAMVEDALEGDGLVAMAQLKPGWETGSQELPDVFPVVCVGQIVHSVRLQDGCFNLVLRGTHRARVVSELPLERPFRRIDVELLADSRFEPNESQEHALRSDLLKGFRQLFPNLELKYDLHHIFESDIPLGVLCDVFAYSLQLEPVVSQQLLAERDIGRRCKLLLELMQQELTDKTVVPRRDFPPQFSLN